MNPPTSLPARTTITVAVALATAALFVACGGDEEADYSGDADSNAVQTVEVTASDFSFTPATLTAEVGGSFNLVLTNAGDAAHTFTIDEFDLDAEVAPGEETSVTVSPSESGEFTYYCRFHQDQGMEGGITVSGRAGAGDTDSPESPAEDGDYNY